MLTDTGTIESHITELRIYPSFTEIRQEYDAPRVCYFLTCETNLCS